MLPFQEGFIWSNTSRAASKTIFCIRNLRPSSARSISVKLGHVGLALDDRGQLRQGRRVRLASMSQRLDRSRSSVRTGV